MPTATISAWSRLEDPAAAASRFLSSLATWPAQARNAALASIPGRDDIADAFAAARHRGGPLSGVPFFTKDLWDLPPTPTHAGSSFLASLRPPGPPGALPSRLIAAGAVAVGKTHLHEFAYGLTGENPHYGDVFQPHHPGHLTGGSSSGSAWAVAAGLVPFALATDTGGSIRVPAAFCGLWGVRLVPEHWTIADAFPLSRTFDTAGWFTRSAADAARVLDVVLDAPAATPHLPQRGVFLLPADLGDPDPDPAVTAALGAAAPTFADPAPDDVRHALADLATRGPRAFAVIQSTDAWETHASWLDTHRSAYDPAVWARIDRGRRWSDADQAEARTTLASARSLLLDLLDRHGFLALPCAPFPALTKASANDDARNRLLRLTSPASLARLPCVTIPIPLPDGLSTGWQVILPDPAAALAFLRLSPATTPRPHHA